MEWLKWILISILFVFGFWMVSRIFWKSMFKSFFEEFSSFLNNKEKTKKEGE